MARTMTCGDVACTVGYRYDPLGYECPHGGAVSVPPPRQDVTDHLFAEPPLSVDDPLRQFCAYEGHGYPLPCRRGPDEHRAEVA